MLIHRYLVEEKDDPYVALVEETASIFSSAAVPGAWLVEVLPWCTFVLPDDWFTLLTVYTIFSEESPCLVSRRFIPTSCSTWKRIVDYFTIRAV